MLRLQTLFALLACCFLASRAVSIPTNNAEDVSAGRNDHNLASLQETITTHMNALALAHNITSSTLVSTFFDRNDSILYTERVYHPYLDHLDLQRGSFERDFYLSFIYLLRWMPLKDAHSVSPDFIARNIELALKARQLNTLTQAVPFSVFLNEVLPYAILTEHRDDWRDLFFSSFFPLVQHASSLREAAAIMNKQSWHIVEPAIKFVAAPPNELNNYSPFSVMKAHNASCTGLSIFLVDALRSVGKSLHLHTESRVETANGPTDRSYPSK